MRYDKNESVDQAGAPTADDEAFSPRLSAVYDPKGDGKHRFTVGYGQYAASIDNGVNDEASSADEACSVDPWESSSVLELTCWLPVETF